MTNDDPTRRDLALFGALLPVFSLVFGIGLGHRVGSVAVERAVWIVGGALSVAYLAWPRARRPVFVGFSRATRPIGVVVSTVLLLVVHLAVITPIGLLLRLFRRDPLERRSDPSAPTYWVGRDADRSEPKRYLRQF
jgi:hypothetical protein